MFSSSGTEILPLKPHHPLCRLVCAGATDRGRQRSRNEDRYGIFPELGLFVVADGMGGTSGGEVAAQMAVELVCEAFVDPDATWPGRAAGPSGGGLPHLVAAVERANHCIHGLAQLDPKLRGMGTTVVAVLACGERAAIAHVGDSRLYRLRGRRFDPLTEDHSLFNDFVRAGLVDPHRPEDFAHRNIITRAVGSASSVEVEARMIDVAPGDTFLLCSDGLYGVVDHREIAAIVIQHADLHEAAVHLIARANDAGGPDNITVALVRWEAMEARQIPTPARAVARSA